MAVVLSSGIVLASIAGADLATARLRENATESTTATMPYWDDVLPATERRFKHFYAYCQFLATLGESFQVTRDCSMNPRRMSRRHQSLLAFSHCPSDSARFFPDDTCPQVDFIHARIPLHLHRGALVSLSRRNQECCISRHKPRIYTHSPTGCASSPHSAQRRSQVRALDSCGCSAHPIRHTLPLKQEGLYTPWNLSKIYRNFTRGSPAPFSQNKKKAKDIFQGASIEAPVGYSRRRPDACHRTSTLGLQRGSVSAWSEVHQQEFRGSPCMLASE